MRIAKFSFLILGLAGAMVGCSNKEQIRSVNDSFLKNKAVRIATAAINLPFEFGEGTGVKGFDVDIGEEICKDLGYPAKWIKVTHDQVLEVLRTGGVELSISAIGITPERKKLFAFSEPYFISDTSIGRRRDHPEITDLASLKGKKVGVQALTVAEEFMASQQTAQGVTLVKFPTLDDGLGALNRQEIDAVVGDEYIMTYSIYSSFSNLITTGARLKEKPIGIAVRQEEKEFLGKINATLERLRKSGELENLRQKWFKDLMEKAKADRENIAKEEALKKAPKLVTINIIKSADAAVNMDRLDGFQAELVGSGSRYSSEPILTNGNRGACKFSAAIPPGDYKLNMSIFRLSVDIKVPEKAVSTLTFDMNITSRGINITER